MALKKAIVNGFAAAAVAVVVTGCGVFESSDGDTVEMFRIKPGQKNVGTNVPGAGQGIATPAPDAGSASFDPNGGGKGGIDDLNKAGDWGTGTQNPYDDFGTLIPGVTLPTVYFSYDRAIISSTEEPKLDEIARYLIGNPGTGVVIEGNCDDRGSDEYNRALGERRALAAKEYLLKKGIQENRIRTISYGEERPAADNASDEGRAKNRRDDFVAVKLKK